MFRNYRCNEFYCTKCGQKGISIFRDCGRLRKAGHLKKLFCIECQEETNHAEVDLAGPYDRKEFQMEFELGRFVNGKRIPIADLMHCSEYKCEYNKKGRCWNANHSYDCQHEPEERV